jgi:hypothetical protein
MLARRQACEPVKPVLHPLEVPSGNVVVEVGVPVSPGSTPVA